METTENHELPSNRLEGLYALLAHDVRGPANVLSITAELLESAVDRAGTAVADPEKLKRYAGTLKIQSRRLTRRLDALLQTFGGPHLARASLFDLTAMTEAAVQQAATQTGAGRHATRVE
jgi:signal transduction histidine kinase